MLRAKTLECAVLMGAAVGREKFYSDAMGLLAVLVETQQKGLEADDPQMPYFYSW